MGESCPDSRDGAIDLELMGGSAPFTYLWSTAATSQDISGLDIGVYDVLILDSANCNTRDTFEIKTWGGVEAAFDNYPVAQGMQFADQSLADSTIVSWHWDFGTGVVADSSTEQSPVFDYGISGTFMVCLRVEDIFGCSDSICELVSYTVGLDPALYQPIQLFPNPTDGYVSIDLRVLAGEHIRLEVFDLLGKRVHVSERIAETQASVDVSGLSAGLYHVRVMAEGNYFQAKLLIE